MLKVYRVDRNNFYKNKKENIVYTPESTSEFLFSIISKKIKKGLIFDPCVGKGSLLLPFLNAGYEVYGLDIKDQGFKSTDLRDYLKIKKGEIKTPSLVIMNPPFNINNKTVDYIQKKYGKRPLLPEVWLSKAIELFGKNIPIVLFTPYGFRLNQTFASKRWQKFIKGQYPAITSIISLPKNLFNNVTFHSEILIFNIKGLNAHYFCKN